MKLTLIGAGRAPQTKELRRLTQPRRRSFFVGPLQITPQKRIDVTVEFCRKHFTTIVPAIQNGTLLVRHNRDRFVDPAELKTLCFGTEEEQKALLEQNEAELKAQADAVIEETQQALQDGLGAEDAAASAAAELTAADAANAAEQKGYELIKAEEEAAANAAEDAAAKQAQAAAEAAFAASVADKIREELSAESPMMAAVPAADVPVHAAPGEETPAAEEAPAAESATEEASVEEKAPAGGAAPAKVELPKGWEERSVPELADLAKSLGLTPNPDAGRKSLVKAIKKVAQ